MRLGVLHERTLPYSPYQNGKQESFWGQVEGRLLAMLDGCEDLTLARLNEATLAWMEMEYNRKVHSETGERPAALRSRQGCRTPVSAVRRPSAGLYGAVLDATQERWDDQRGGPALRNCLPATGTSTPSASAMPPGIFRMSTSPMPASGIILGRLYPQDKQKNADARRRHKSRSEWIPSRPPRPANRWPRCCASSLPNTPPPDCLRLTCPKIRNLNPKEIEPMSKKLLALYGLKYNPFCQDVPVSALSVTPAIESFCWRIENQLGEGGFALVTGAPGTGKSAVLRILRERLGSLRDLSVGILSRPQASVADFYRELGDLFGDALSASNRWGGAKVLRQNGRLTSRPPCTGRCC
jgi:hypothetical protein